MSATDLTDPTDPYFEKPGEPRRPLVSDRAVYAVCVTFCVTVLGLGFGWLFHRRPEETLNLGTNLAGWTFAFALLGGTGRFFWYVLKEGK